MPGHSRRCCNAIMHVLPTCAGAGRPE
ncbi:hypothetical protein LDHU3_29.1510:CDS1 [Leishmania donovani]|nr:hypothetical protein LDHU3_29.1510:CDS1 [Leishmania donovani]